LKDILKDLNLDIELAEKAVADGSGKKPAGKPISPLATPQDGDVDALVQKKYIYSLICTLRARQTDKQLEAALVLLRFARDAADGKDVRIGSEICSSGGMHALLSLSQSSQDTSDDLNIVAALAVAHLLPSFLTSSLCPLSVSLEIIHSLRDLSRAKAHHITSGNEVITLSLEESYRASAEGISLLWRTQLKPRLLKSENKPSEEALALALVRGTSRSIGGRMFDQRRESIQLQELLEMTVSLIVRVVSLEEKFVYAGDELFACRLVEQMCQIELARPIAAREGVLTALVSMHCPTSSSNDVTLTFLMITYRSDGSNHTIRRRFL
jgi:hypothetical protein